MYWLLCSIITYINIS